MNAVAGLIPKGKLSSSRGEILYESERNASLGKPENGTKTGNIFW